MANGYFILGTPALCTWCEGAGEERQGGQLGLPRQEHGREGRSAGSSGTHPACQAAWASGQPGSPGQSGIHRWGAQVWGPPRPALASRVWADYHRGGEAAPAVGDKPQPCPTPAPLPPARLPPHCCVVPPGIPPTLGHVPLRSCLCSS